MDNARYLLAAVGVYAGAGVLFGVPFVVRGIETIDPAARNTRWGFRVLVFPGVVALWPVMARRWALALRTRR